MGVVDVEVGVIGDVAGFVVEGLADSAGDLVCAVADVVARHALRGQLGLTSASSGPAEVEEAHRHVLGSVDEAQVAAGGRGAGRHFPARVSTDDPH